MDCRERACCGIPLEPVLVIDRQDSDGQREGTNGTDLARGGEPICATRTPSRPEELIGGRWATSEIFLACACQGAGTGIGVAKPVRLEGLEGSLQGLVPMSAASCAKRLRGAASCTARCALSRPLRVVGLWGGGCGGEGRGGAARVRVRPISRRETSLVSIMCIESSISGYETTRRPRNLSLGQRLWRQPVKPAHEAGPQP
jgi:hypothetical protein